MKLGDAVAVGVAEIALIKISDITHQVWVNIDEKANMLL